MSIESITTHEIKYDGKTSELYKIYLLSILLSIVTLGLYHFWGKTRKRRYITSSFSLDKDRFEYTGYGSELLIGLVFGLIILFISFVPLLWATYEIKSYNDPQIQATISALRKKSHQQEKAEPIHHFEQVDPFGNKVVVDYNDIVDFSFELNKYYFYIKYRDNFIEIRWKAIDVPMQTIANAVNSQGQLQFNPRKSVTLLIAVLLIPLYMIFYFAYLPFVIVYGSLRYRVSRLRWRGIRGHVDGSSLMYGLLGLGNTIMKFLTLGLWIPVSDIIMYKHKMKKFYFGNQQMSFTPSIKPLILMNFATIGASLYLIGLMAICAYWLLPLIISFIPSNGMVLATFIARIVKESYFVTIIILIWICYLPRYWYRAAFLRERYNNLHFGNLSFTCGARGWDYLKLFVINDLIFIFTLSFGLPFIWQRRMKFFSKHVKIVGNLNEISIEQAKGKKTKFGGGFASIMNLEIGLI
jgi:uncharacterized membrane protein YjgN (DUF898 family)